MTVLYLSLLLPLLPLWSIAVDLHEDRANDVEIARLTAELPPARANLDPWPEPLSPLDLPGIGHTETLAAIELRPRVFVAVPPPLVVGLAVIEGRHHIGVAPGTEDQRARWDSPTGQFKVLVAATWSQEEQETLSREWWCESCLDDHRDCGGVCACPCTLLVPA